MKKTRQTAADERLERALITIPALGHKHINYVFVREGGDYFLRTVDEAKRIIGLYLEDEERVGRPVRQKTLRRQDATRRAMEALFVAFSYYFGRTHLAVALCEMGFSLEFVDEDSFRANWASDRLRRAILRAWDYRDPIGATDRWVRKLLDERHGRPPYVEVEKRRTARTRSGRLT
jgi:hypothetical protein